MPGQVTQWHVAGGMPTLASVVPLQAGGPQVPVRPPALISSSPGALSSQLPLLLAVPKLSGPLPSTSPLAGAESLAQSMLAPPTAPQYHLYFFF